MGVPVINSPFTFQYDFVMLEQGLRIAWRALSLYYGTVIPTGEEARMFFTSFGQQWCR